MRTSFVFTLWLILWPGAAAVLAQEATPSGGRLADLVAVLERANPDVTAARRAIDMREARIKPAGVPPDPIVSGRFMGWSNPNAMREFSVSQELPYPGTLSLRSRVAMADTDTARAAADEVRLARVADLKTMYVDYRLLDRSLSILRRNRARLQQVARLTETRFSVGHGTQQDIVKAQLELSLLTEREIAVAGQQSVLRARLNGLLDRAPHEPIDPALAFDIALPASDIAELQRLAEERYPALRRDELVVQRNEHALALARKDILPDFGARVSAQKYAAGMPWMYGVEVMVNVPIFANRKQRPMVAEAAAAVSASRSMRDATRAAAFARIGDQFAVAESSRTLVRLYEDSVLPQARLALDAALASYETGKVDFLTLVTNFTTILEYELGLEEQQAQHYRALANLEPLVGRVFLV